MTTTSLSHDPSEITVICSLGAHFFQGSLGLPLVDHAHKSDSLTTYASFIQSFS